MVSKYALSFVYFSLDAVIMTLNGYQMYCLIAFNKSGRKRRTFSSTLLLNLSAADFWVGVGLCVTDIVYFLMKGRHISPSKATKKYIFMTSEAVALFACLSSLLNLCNLTLDRLIGICFPLKYSKILNRTRVNLLIIAAWVLSFFISIASALLYYYMKLNITVYITFVTVGIGSFLFLVTYTFAFVVLKKRKLFDKQKASNRIYKKMKKRQEFRLLKISVGILLGFIIFWWPVVGLHIHIYTTKTWKQYQEVLITILMQSKSIFNPLVYFKWQLKHVGGKRVKASDFASGTRCTNCPVQKGSNDTARRSTSRQSSNKSNRTGVSPLLEINTDNRIHECDNKVGNRPLIGNTCKVKFQKHIQRKGFEMLNMPGDHQLKSAFRFKRNKYHTNNIEFDQKQKLVDEDDGNQRNEYNVTIKTPTTVAVHWDDTTIKKHDDEDQLEQIELSCLPGTT